MARTASSGEKENKDYVVSFVTDSSKTSQLISAVNANFAIFQATLSYAKKNKALVASVNTVTVKEV